MYKRCVYVQMLCLCTNAVFMHKCYVFTQILCLCTNAVIMYKCCANVQMLCLCTNAVFIYKCCDYVQMLCLCTNAVFMYVILNENICKRTNQNDHSLELLLGYKYCKFNCNRTKLFAISSTSRPSLKSPLCSD